jgi:uncharacterized MAPEG superfamily protein
MTTDLTMLVASALLCMIIPVIYGVGRGQRPGGTPWGLGNRDTPFELPPWAARAQRAHTNMIENLAPFAILVLVAHVSGKANGTTALGAELFFVSRVAHLVTYVAGLVPWRTVVYFGGMIGELMILSQLF